MEKWHTLDSKSVFSKLGASQQGLSENEAHKRLEKYGPNKIQQEKKISPIRLFLGQFTSVLVIILILATVFSFVIGEIVDAMAILIIVILNAIFGFVQEYRAERAIEALKKLTNPETLVLRGGEQKTIYSDDVVPGDIILLEEGARIPADLRLIEAINLRIDEAALTGESAPVTKVTHKLKDLSLPDRKNMAYMGTLVTYGRGKGVVTGTGMTTEIGHIAKLIEKAEDEATPLQQKLGAFGKKLAVLILLICISVIGIGFFRGHGVIDMILTGIALAVAAIPEGLPAVVTITLAIGLQKMSKHNALIRRLPAVETLGSTSVICADKTGTLTKNEMTARKLWVHDTTVNISGRGFEPAGNFTVRGKKIDPTSNYTMDLALKAGICCNNSMLNKSGEEYSVVGDPTEAAFVVMGQKVLDVEKTRAAYKRLNEIPFSSERKMMSVVVTHDHEKIVFAKGAPEVILAKSSHILKNGRSVRLTEKDRKKIIEENKKLTNQALRVLALAYKPNPKSMSDHSVERELTFIGLVGMIDPPRESVKSDIERCGQAGIKVVMITGDHQNTAVAVAKEIGIDASKSLTGQDLDKMSDEQLEKEVLTVGVYARVNPEHKMKIVSALKKRGRIVAMTGDGVNDAPALKRADIGVSMGIKGTDVAKEASDMVLRDDNFSSIVDAVEAGRGIYDNIRKFIEYLLSANLGEVLIVFLALLIGITDPKTGLFVLPVVAVQLLWINLLTDGMPALALGVDPPAKNIMQRKPRDAKENILTRQSWEDLIIVALIMTAGALYLFYTYLPIDASVAVTMVFTSIVFYELFWVNNVRLKYGAGFFSNKKLLIALCISLLLQFVVIYTPFLQEPFETAALSLEHWMMIVAVTAPVFVIMWIKHKFIDKLY